MDLVGGNDHLEGEVVAEDVEDAGQGVAPGPHRDHLIGVEFDCRTQHQEILQYTEGREVRLEDSDDLHLCQAFMAEVQRHGQVALTSVMHRVSKEVGQYSILLSSLDLPFSSSYHPVTSSPGTAWSSPTSRSSSLTPPSGIIPRPSVLTGFYLFFYRNLPFLLASQKIIKSHSTQMNLEAVMYIFDI